MRISDWSSDVCSSDLTLVEIGTPEAAIVLGGDTSHQVPARSEVEALLQSRYDGENRGAGHPEPAIIIAWPRKVGVPCILCNERDVQFGFVRHIPSGGQFGPINPRFVGNCRPLDRTSVVSGTSVSVRFALVGRHICNKKKKP